MMNNLTARKTCAKINLLLFAGICVNPNTYAFKFEIVSLEFMKIY